MTSHAHDQQPRMFITIACFEQTIAPGDLVWRGVLLRFKANELDVDDEYDHDAGIEVRLHGLKDAGMVEGSMQGDTHILRKKPGSALLCAQLRNNGLSRCVRTHPVQKARQHIPSCAAANQWTLQVHAHAPGEKLSRCCWLAASQATAYHQHRVYDHALLHGAQLRTLAAEVMSFL